MVHSSGGPPRLLRSQSMLPPSSASSIAPAKPNLFSATTAASLPVPFDTSPPVRPSLLRAATLPVKPLTPPSPQYRPLTPSLPPRTSQSIAIPPMPLSTDSTISRWAIAWKRYCQSHQLIPVTTPSTTQVAVQSAGAPVHPIIGDVVPYILTLSPIAVDIPPIFQQTRGLFGRVSVSSFNLITRRWFGRTWMSEKISLSIDAASNRQTINVPAIYYRSPIHDDTCIGVIEVSIITPALECVSCGWTTIELFGLHTNTLTDITTAVNGSLRSSDELYKRRTLTRSLWYGTPRMLSALPQNAHLLDWPKSFQRRNEAFVISYELFTCQSLTPLYAFFNDNEFIGEGDMVGGVGIMPAYAHLLTPLYLQPCSITVTRPLIRLPADLESRILNEIRLSNALAAAPSHAHIEIVRRTLTMGLHNGHRYISPPALIPLLLTSSNAANQQTLSFDGTLSINDLHCNIANNDRWVCLVSEIVYEYQWSPEKQSILQPTTPSTKLVVASSYSVLGRDHLQLYDTLHTLWFGYGALFTEKTHSDVDRQFGSVDTHIVMAVTLNAPGLQECLGDAPQRPVTPTHEPSSMTMQFTHYDKREEHEPEPLPPVKAVLVTPVEETKTDTSEAKQVTVPFFTPAPAVSVAIQTQPTIIKATRSTVTTTEQPPSESIYRLTLQSLISPLIGHAITIRFSSIHQTIQQYTMTPIHSLQFAMSFFDQRPWKSSNIILDTSIITQNNNNNNNNNNLEHTYSQTDTYIHPLSHISYDTILPSIYQLHTKFIIYWSYNICRICLYDTHRLMIIGYIICPLYVLLRGQNDRRSSMLALPIYQYTIENNDMMTTSTGISSSNSSSISSSKPIIGTINLTLTNIGLKDDLMNDNFIDVDRRTILHTADTIKLLRAVTPSTTSARSSNYMNIIANPYVNVSKPLRIRSSLLNAASGNRSLSATTADLGRTFNQTLRGSTVLNAGNFNRSLLLPTSSDSNTSRAASIFLSLPNGQKSLLSQTINRSDIDRASLSMSPEDLMSASHAFSSTMQTVETIRTLHHHELVINAIKQSITVERTIIAEYAQCYFTEFLITNPYEQSMSFIININDPYNHDNHNNTDINEISIVTDMDEWRALKRQWDIDTPLAVGWNDTEVNDLNTTISRRSTSFTIRLTAKQTIYIPIKFQSFATQTMDYIDHCIFPLTRINNNNNINNNNERIMMQRDITICVNNIDGITIATLLLHIKPQSFIIDYSILQHTQADNNNNNIYHNQLNITDIIQSRSISQTHQIHHNIGPPNIFISSISASNPSFSYSYVAGHQMLSYSLSVGTYPSRECVILALYTDEYRHCLLRRVALNICVHLPAQMSIMTGRSVHGHIIMPETDRTRHVRITSSAVDINDNDMTFNSHPQQTSIMKPHSSAQIVLRPGNTNRVNYTYRSARNGDRQVLVHLIGDNEDDNNTQTRLINSTTEDEFNNNNNNNNNSIILHSWLISIKSCAPIISQTFDLQCSNHSINRKSFDYTNHNNINKKYLIESSNNLLVKLKNHLSLFEILANHSTIIQLIIHPPNNNNNNSMYNDNQISTMINTQSYEVVYLYVSDEFGVMEECLQLNITFN